MSPLLTAIVIGAGFAAVLLALMVWLRPGSGRANGPSSGDAGADGATNAWMWGSTAGDSSSDNDSSCDTSSDGGGGDSCGSDGGGD